MDVSPEELNKTLLRKDSRDASVISNEGSRPSRRITTCVPPPPVSKKPRRGSRRLTSSGTSFTLRRTSSKLSLASMESGDGALNDTTANLEGVETIIKQILGDDYKYVEKAIPSNFDVYAVGGKLDHEGFVVLMDSLLDDKGAERESMTTVRRSVEKRKSTVDKFSNDASSPSRRASLSSQTEEDEFHIQETLQGNTQFSRKHWGLLYCGGSQPVVDQLKSYKRKFGIALSIEKFDW